MGRVTIKFKDSNEYISVEAEEMHEDNGFLKAYSDHNELVAMVDISVIKAAYFTEEKSKNYG